MAGLYDDAHLAALTEGLRGLTPEWGLSPRTRVRLLNISENATFRADDPEAEAPLVVRVHRPGYHTLAEIDSELAWIDALRAAGAVATPAPVPARDGRRLVGFAPDGAPRQAAAFAFMSGAEPDPDGDLAAGFEELGAISARLHAHVRDWRRPAGFTRKAWDFDATVGDRPLWGDWRAGQGLTPEGRAVLERAVADLRARLGAYGTGPDRFGLIHADLRLANLLQDGDRLGVIDFDDCGFGWLMFDFAAAVSFIETDPRLADLAAAWARGYRTVAPLAATDEAMLPALVMLRRIQLTAWIASHAETPTAQEMGPQFTTDTVAMADRYLSRGPEGVWP